MSDNAGDRIAGPFGDADNKQAVANPRQYRELFFPKSNRQLFARASIRTISQREE
jgi:hypothetical protein